MQRFFTRFVCLFLFCTLILSSRSFSQTCAGADGSPAPGGGLIQELGGDICANTAVVPGQMRIVANNVDDNGNPNAIGFEIDWDDNSPLEVVTFLAGQVLNTGPNAYQAVVTHFFPPNGGDVKCEYFPTVRLMINGTACPSTLGIPPRFVRWNTEDENSGVLELSETATGVTEFLVCQGVRTTVTFTDRTTLNCIPPELDLLSYNDRRRWRRFTYGTANSITSATGVQIAGVFQGFPFQETEVQSGTATGVNVPPPPTQTSTITIPADALTGQIFEITMEYWNFCNRFDLARAPVTTTARIRIVDQPPAPGVAGPNIVCFGTTPLPSFQTTVAGTPTVFWYRDNAGVPGTLITSGPSKSLPTSSYPGGINSNTPGLYRVWVSYNAVNADAVTCESPKVPVLLTIVEDLAQPAVISGATDICNNQSVTFTLPAIAGTTPNGGPAEYEWSSTGGLGVTLTGTTPTTATFNINVGGVFTTANRTIRVRKRYTTNHAGTGCPTTYRTLPIIIYGPSVGGTASGGSNVCEGADVGTITLAGERGTIQRWEVSINGGAFFNSGLPTTNSINPGTLAAGNYLYRAVVGNGPCAEANSNNVAISVSVNPSPAAAGIDQELCSAILTSTSLGGSDPTPGTGLWTVVSQPGGSSVNFDGLSNNPNTTITVSDVGIYTLRWTVTNGTCITSDDIVVDFGTDPGIQSAGADTPVCGPSFTLNGSTPIIGTGTWTMTGAPPGGTVSFDNINLPGATVTLTPAGSEIFGAYTFQWSVVSGFCTPQTASVVITFSRPATASAPANFTKCVDPASPAPFNLINLSGAVGAGLGAGQMGRWETIGGFGTFTSNGFGAAGSNIVGPTINDSYTPLGGDFTAGSVQFRLVAVDPDDPPGGPCTNVNSTTLTVTFDRLPTSVDAGPPQSTICTATGTLAALAPVNGTGIWSDPFLTGITFTNVNDRNTPISNIPIGNSTLRWTVNSTLGVCVAPTSDVLLTRNPPHVVNNLAPEVCEAVAGGGTATSIDLTTNDNSVTGGDATSLVEWFTDPGPAGPIAPANTPQTVSNSSPSSLTFFTRVTSPTTCPNTGTVTYVINTLPDAIDFSKSFCEELPVGSNQVNDIDLNAADIIAGVTGGMADRSVTWWEDAAATTLPIATPGDYDIIGSRVVFARVRNTLTDCEDIAQVDLVISARPVDQTIQGSPTACVGATQVYQVVPIPGATYQWVFPPDFTNILGGGPTDFIAFVSFPTATVGPVPEIKVTISVNGCAGNELALPVDVSVVPPAFTIIAPPGEICENEMGVQFSVTPNNYPTSNYNWEIIPPNAALVVIGQTTGSVFINFLTDNVTIKVTETNSANCTSSVSPTYDVTIRRRPILADDLSKEVCSEDDANIVLVESPLSPVPATSYFIDSPVAVDPGLFLMNGPTSGAVGASGIALDRFENPSGGALRVRYSVRPISADGCDGDPKIVQLTVKPEPLLDTTIPPAVCSSQPLNKVLTVVSGSIPADIFIIDSVVPDAGLTAGAGNPLALGSFSSTVLVDDVWQNQTSAPLYVTYNIRPYNSITFNCAGTPAVPLTFAINPEPLVTPDAKAICSGDLVNLALTSINVASPNFIWTVKSATPGIAGASIGIGTSIQDILTNTTGAPGTVVYSVKALSPQNCEGLAQDITITVDPAPPVNNINETTCSDVAGGNTVVRDLTTLESTINNSLTVTFEWYRNAGLTNQIFPPDLTAYVLTNNAPVYAKVRNTTGNTTCFSVAIVTFEVNPLPLLQTTKTDFNFFGVSCNGSTNGVITANATLGQQPYFFRLDGGTLQTLNNFSGLSARTGYIVTVEDANGCVVDSPPIDLLEPPPLLIDGTPVPVICKGDDTGSISITGSGGVPAYGYSLNGSAPQALNLFEGLTAGVYSISIIDANGCTTLPTTRTVTEPAQVTGTTTQINVNCKNENTGSITVTGNGGTGPYDFSLDGGTFQSNGTFGSLLTGNYTIVVRDASFCTSANISVNILEPAVELALVVDNQINVSCNTGTDGSVVLRATGGVGSYAFDDGSNTFSNAAGVFTALGNGSYSFSVRDGNLCVKTIPVTITEPGALALSLDITEVDCHGDPTGIITASATGGSGSYEFSKDGINFGPSNRFDGLLAGPYTIHVRDGNAIGCTTNLTDNVPEPSAVGGSVVQTKDVICFLGTEAELTAVGSGGVGIHTYVLLQDPANADSPAGVFNNIRAGTYTVRITDERGCNFITPQIVVAPVTQIKVTGQVTSNFNGFHLSCDDASDGVIQATATGGTALSGFTFSILPDPQNAGSNNTGLFTGLPADFYTITVVDNGCDPVSSIPVAVNAPFPLSPGFVGFDQFVCANEDPDEIESIVAPFGGTLNYVYEWQESLDDITYTTVAGANSLTYNPPQLAQTTYFKRIVTLGSGNTSGNCAPKETLPVKITVNELPDVTLTGPDIVCKGDPVVLTLTVTQGQAPVRYTYTATNIFGTTTFPDRIAGTTTPIFIPNYQDATTFKITEVRDFYGCITVPGPLGEKFVDIRNANTSFTIDPNSQCSGLPFTFEWDVIPGFTYTWQWGDGTPDEPSSAGTIPHVYNFPVTGQSTTITVVLQAVDETGVCDDRPVEGEVTVYPSVLADIPSVDQTICSGTSIHFENATDGATTHKWFYRVQGATNEEFVQSSVEADFTFSNDGAIADPLVYEVIYEGSNADGCSDSELIEIYVSRNSVANIGIGTINEYRGGVSEMQVTNNSTEGTSTVLNGTVFDYTWDFGNEANPDEALDDATKTFDIDYASPGTKKVTLTVTNKSDPSCSTKDSETFTIPVPPFEALFTVTPLASCAPTVLTTNNLSSTEAANSETFLWVLEDESGNEIAASNLNEPIFEIQAGGVYSLTLTAKLTSTGQFDTHVVSNIEVFSKPHAIFTARPKQFFVPDTPVDMINDSQGASGYSWNFGDDEQFDEHQIEPTHLYALEGTYIITLIAEYDHGLKDVLGNGDLVNVTCYDEVTQEVVGLNGGATKIPNAFTPSLSGPSGGVGSGNGINDVFLPITSGVADGGFLMQIFDRWGNLVFESKDQYIGWDGYDKDGRLLPAGVYVYKLVLLLSNEQRETRIGDVMMIR